MKNEKDAPVHIFSSWCKKCGICISVCPKNVLERGSCGIPFAARPEDCIKCGLCDIHCPDFAISISKKEEEHEEAE